MNIKKIIIDGLYEKFCKNTKQSTIENNDTEESKRYAVGRWFNFLDEKTIRGSRLESVKEILRRNNINFKEEKVYVSWSSGYVNQIVLFE